MVFNNLENQKNTRPDGLSLLCWLSFIGSGLSAFFQLISGIFLPLAKSTMLYDNTYEALYSSFPGMKEAVLQMLNLGSTFYLANALLYALSFVGALLMYRRIYKGFHVYTIAQCLLILWMMFRMGQWGVPWGSIFFSGAFVAMYSLHLSYLKNTPPEPPYKPE